MKMAEQREPYESRGSRTVLGEPGGESPPGHSTFTSGRLGYHYVRIPLIAFANSCPPASTYTLHGSSFPCDDFLSRSAIIETPLGKRRRFNDRERQCQNISSPCWPALPR